MNSKLTQEQLIAVIVKLFPTLDHPSCTCLCGLDLSNLTDEQVYALLAWEMWKDGMDWDQGVEDITTGQYLPFNTRQSAIDHLKTAFGYQ